MKWLHVRFKIPGLLAMIAGGLAVAGPAAPSGDQTHPATGPASTSRRLEPS
jgi:hypothetical protein